MWNCRVPYLSTDNHLKLERGEALRVLVRNRDQGSYLKGDGHWTNAISEARDFVTCAKAIEMACAAKIKEAEIVMAFNEPGFELVMSLNGMEEKQKH